MNNGLRKLIFFLLAIGLIYVSYAYMIRPANDHLAQQKIKVTQKLAKLSELEAATSAAQDLSKQLKRVEEAITVFESKLPPRSEVYTVLEDMTVIAQKHGLRTKSIRTLKIKENNGYIEQPLKMQLDGNFNSYYSFLLELEKMDRITKIRELTLKKASKQEGYTEATFVVSIFFQDKNV